MSHESWPARCDQLGEKPQQIHCLGWSGSSESVIKSQERKQCIVIPRFTDKDQYEYLRKIRWKSQRPWAPSAPTRPKISSPHQTYQNFCNKQKRWHYWSHSNLSNNLVNIFSPASQPHGYRNFRNIAQILTHPPSWSGERGFWSLSLSQGPSLSSPRGPSSWKRRRKKLWRTSCIN